MTCKQKSVIFRILSIGFMVLAAYNTSVAEDFMGMIKVAAAIGVSALLWLCAGWLNKFASEIIEDNHKTD